jgi:hypothetical protein
MERVHGARLSSLTLEQGRAVLDTVLNSILQRPLRSTPFIELFHPLS